MTLTEPVFAESASQPLRMERRRGLRVAERRPIKVFEPITGRFFGGSTRDVSTTGLRLTLPSKCPVREGSELRLTIGQPGGSGALVPRRSMVHAQVVWSRQTPNGTDVGVELSSSVQAAAA